MNTQTQEALKIIEKAEWLADKIVAFGDYGQEAALRLRQLAQMQREALEQPAQEPVAWMMVHREPEHGAAYLTFDKPSREQKISHHPYELYTHPAPSWQGLKRDDVIPILKKHGYEFTSTLYYLLNDFEQALREKNDKG